MYESKSQRVSATIGSAGRASWSSVWRATMRGFMTASCVAAALQLAACESDGGSSSSADSASSTGTGGSTARMAIDGDYLYAIAGSQVQVFDITQPQAPNPWARVQVEWDIETLFPYEDYLLIGAETGMHIMDNTDPASPQYLARFTHARARDPVVAKDGYAYVTLKSGPFGGVDQMDVIDIREIANPSLVRTINMQGPSGLGIGEDKLYVCDDVAGLKIFDLTVPDSPSVIDTIRNVNCNDVIAKDGILYVITDSFLRQYDIQATPPVLLSEVSKLNAESVVVDESVSTQR